MNYKNKYLKYKLKYSLLKKHTEGNKIINQNGGRKTGKVIRLHNTGTLEDIEVASHRNAAGVASYPASAIGPQRYVNQCFWISILQYLNAHGYEELTLEQLRDIAGLNGIHERVMVDTFEEDIKSAIYKVLCVFNNVGKINLRIRIFSIRRDIINEDFDATVGVFGVEEHGGKPISPELHDHLYNDETHPHIINIARTEDHFELIIGFEDDGYIDDTTLPDKVLRIYGYPPFIANHLDLFRSNKDKLVVLDEELAFVQQQIVSLTTTVPAPPDIDDQYLQLSIRIAEFDDDKTKILNDIRMSKYYIMEYFKTLRGV